MSDLDLLDSLLAPGPHPRVRTPGAVLRAVAAFLVVPVLIGVLLGAGMVAPSVAASRTVGATRDAWASIPVDPAVLTTRLAGHTVLLDADGHRFADLYTEDRVPLPSLDDVSPHLVDAVLSVEDRGFFHDGALDPRGIARALVTGTGGGSGITQQYAKLLRAASATGDEARQAATEASLARKLVELRYAVALEEKMTKEEILLGYLNTAYFGNGAYGVGAAARRYFGTDAAHLSIAQSAMLAGLLQAPDAYDPTRHPEAAEDRRATALSMMVDNGVITRAEYEAALAEPIKATTNTLPSGCAASRYPYYCDWVKEVLLSDPAFGASADERLSAFQRGGIVVRTALVPSIQDALQANLKDNFASDTIAAAQSVVEPGTGHVLAMVQTTDYAHTQLNLNTGSTVQPGSAFKPITLAAALEGGFPIAATMSGDTPYVPASGSAPEGGFVNLGGVQYGDIDASTALKYSVNTWFVRLAERTGTQRIADMAYRLGMTSMDPATREVGDGDWSITLGAFETTPLDLANVYATLAASGRQCRALPIVAVETTSGAKATAPDPRCTQAVSASVADTVVQALHSTQTSGGTASSLSVPGQSWVGKTGTTTNFGATWFAGATRRFASAVWLGDPASSATPVSGVWSFGTFFDTVYGADVAGPLWAASMRAMTAGTPDEPFPAPGPITADVRALPSVVGLDEAAARAALATAGVTRITTTPVDSDTPPGTVVSQTPAAGRAPTESATLEVSR